ncbi:hypothetical protein AHiyo8_64270 [Arthrobacter sp. Hiyo8]|nr:hypothetical protein AHiyo8_64270 [Arthrobacter sp. Hiyo8]
MCPPGWAAWWWQSSAGLDCCRDLGGQRAVVEGADALLREEPISRGEVVVLEDAADGGCVASWEEQLAGGAERPETELVVECLLAEGLVNDEAPARNLDGRLEGISKA